MRHLNPRVRCNYLRFRITDGRHIGIYFRFPLWPMCSHWHVILHLHAKFRNNGTIDSRVMTSYRFFKMATIESKIYFQVQVSWLDSFKKVEIYLHTKFRRDISITAELKLLPVSENGRPPYWNFTAGFHFDQRVIIGMSFCICLPNFVIIGRLAAELWRHIDFSRWRPQSRKSYFRVQVSWLEWFKKVEIYMHTESRRDISIHGCVKTTSGFGKRTATILEFYFRFRFQPTCSHRHVILYPCAYQSQWLPITCTYCSRLRYRTLSLCGLFHGS